MAEYSSRGSSLLVEELVYVYEPANLATVHTLK